VAYPSSLDRYKQSASSTCVIYNTKDRVDLTQRTIPALAAEGDFDLIWMDGSRTEDGRALPAKLGPTADQLTEIHYGVVGGPDAAIVYALSYALDKGYARIGLVENDVLLAPGWYQAVMALFQKGAQDGLRVGAVTARPYDRRTLWQTADYSVHFGSGAGMIVFSRSAAECILRSYRTTTYTEILDSFISTGAPDFSHIWEASRLDLRRQNQNATSADWFFDAALIRQGMVTLGTVPGYAENIDADMKVKLGVSVTQNPDRNDAENVDFHAWKSALTDASPDGVSVYDFDPVNQLWIAYPHQIAARFPSAFSGDWFCKWDQTCGPFSFVAKNTDARLSLPVEGQVKLVLGPATKWPRRLARFGWPAQAVYQGQWPIYDVGTASDTPQLFTYNCAETGTELKAVAFDRQQPWMQEPVEFRFEHISRFFAE